MNDFNGRYHPSADEPVAFFGREKEKARLDGALADCWAGQRRFLIITGETGIGKTGLATQLAHRAAATGARALWGRSWQGGGAPAFWPWIQIVQSILQGLQPAERLARLGARAHDLAPLVPDLEPQMPGSQEAVREAERGRFELFDAVATLLQTATVEQPLVLIFDDLPYADVPTLNLLRFVARDPRCPRLMLLATCNDLEASGDASLAALLAELSRDSERIPLGGLSPEDVGAMMAALSGRLPQPHQVDRVHDATHGNPFFVSELVHRWKPDAADIAGINGVGSMGLIEAVRQRLRGLLPEDLPLLRLAAVSGREVDPVILQRTVEALSTDGCFAALQVHSCLTRATQSGLLSHNPAPLPVYRFVHGLVRDALCAEMSPSERAAAHQAVASAIAALHRTDLGAHAAQIAWHLEQALPGGDPLMVVSYWKEAGDAAIQQRAYETGADQHRQALRVLSRSAVADDHQRCELLLLLATALMRSTDTATASDTFMQAARVARSIDAPILLARAVLGMTDAGIGLPDAAPDATKLELLEQALHAIGPNDSVWRARLLARLASELAESSGADRCRGFAEQAMTMARRLHDPTTLACVLRDHHRAFWSPDNLAERRALADEMLTVARRSGDEDLLLQAHVWRILDALEQGDCVTVDQGILQYKRRADASRQPRHQWLAKHLEAVRAQSRGAFEEAERLAQEALTFGDQTNDPSARAVFRNVMCGIRLKQGRLAEIESAITTHLAEFSEFEAAACGLAYVYVELGRRAEAHQIFERLAAKDFAGLPRDHAWLYGMACLAEVCSRLEDRERARVLYELLLPFRERIVCVGHPATHCDAPVAFYLGRLAATRASHLDADTHYRASLDICARVDLRPARAMTQYRYAETRLRERGQAVGDTLSLLESAAEAAIRLGMIGLSRSIEALRSEQRVESPTPESPPGPRAQPSECVFRREGEYWRLVFGGQARHLRNSKGLVYIAQLLERPGRAFHAVELVERGASLPVRTSPSVSWSSDSLRLAGDLGDAGELLDAQARAAYEQHLTELDRELIEARNNNDGGAVERAQHELEIVMSELQRATGLGGSVRRARSHAERARVNVTRSISTSIRRIASHHPELATHLSSSIHTGTFCRYEPDPRGRHEWTVS